MKRYLLFMGENELPRGGWNDMFSSFDTVESALAVVGSHEADWWQIVDASTGKIVLGA